MSAKSWRGAGRRWWCRSGRSSSTALTSHWEPTPSSETRSAWRWRGGWGPSWGRRPLGAAVSGLARMDGVKVITFPDVGMLLNAILPAASEMGLTPAEGGVHAGEWETSMMLALRPELVRMGGGEEGYVGAPA